MNPDRREFLKAGLAAGVALLLPPRETLGQSTPLLQKKIPSSGEMIPIIGLGTARRYEEVKTEAEKVPLRETILNFKEVGLRVIDSSPSYGTAEAVVGEIVDGLKIRDSLFLATKVTLREMKQAGRIRYVGITTSFDNQYGEFERTMKNEALDFIQLDYALDNRDAGDRIIPLAADRGMAVMINLPFGRGRLFNAVQGKK